MTAMHGLLASAAMASFLLPVAMLAWAAIDRTQEAVFAAIPVAAWGMLRHTLVVLAVAVPLAGTLGAVAAWLVMRCDMPGRQCWSVALSLPFALPPFLLAAILAGSASEVQALLPGGAVGTGLVLGVLLYPWVYLPLKASLARIGRQQAELAASLGLSGWRGWWLAEGRMLWPTLASALVLVATAVLNDYGTAALLGTVTVSVGAHDAMLNLLRPDWAAQLAIASLALPLALTLVFAGLAPQAATLAPPWQRSDPPPLRRLPPLLAALALLFLLALVTAALLAPLALVLRQAWPALLGWPLVQALPHLATSLVVVGAALTGCLALALAVHLTRPRPPPLWDPVGIAAILCYAIPGAMLALALLLATRDLPPAWARLMLSDTPLLVIAGSILGYGCFAYLTVSHGIRLRWSVSDALCRSLGLTGWRRLRDVDVPLLRPHLAAGALITLLLLLQELPIALILQPFDGRTLAVRLYDSARVGSHAPAALLALLLVCLAIPAAVFLDRVLVGYRHARV